MKDECVYGVWRLRYIDNRTSYVTVVYFGSLDDVRQGFYRIYSNADYTFVDCHRWDSYELRWTKLDDCDSLEKGF